MDRKKLDQLWKDLKAARRSPQKASALEALARDAGRTVQAGGNHPMWKSAFVAHRAFPIGRHGGNPDLSPRVRKVILDHLEADAAAWEDWLDEKNAEPEEEGEE
ncbi:hypothetical protein AB8Z38_04515 [Bradyrhizobium sp. LLZ17]|uniref:Uncharacterized protein n=1 Tax=Bradyrhizobium sp. LLZ17 TaxID=3239388 RepID=A0AB39XPJ7_9BRAD